MKDAIATEKHSVYLSRLLRIALKKDQITDVKNIALDVYAPLAGFLKKEDFESVVETMRLKNGQVWPIPIVLDISKEDYEKTQGQKEILLVDSAQQHVAILKDIEIFQYDKNFFAKNVFGTLDKKHPGVHVLYQMGEYLVGGKIELIDDSRGVFLEHAFTPAETKRIFQERGWKTVVAFQTRNVPHSGHEFLQKEALKEVDGLFVQPVIGEKKLGDFKDEYILASYEILIDKYYPKDRTLLGVLSLKMRYAGPREAVFHAILRKNFGCTHFIVGRDHAGVGNYYAPFAAQEIFNSFKKDEIGITILKYPEVVYCETCQKHMFDNGCEHKKTSFSGTKLRENIQNRQIPLSYIMRPEIFNFLSSSDNSLVDDVYNKQTNQKGFVLWFTGLSQAGKTTNADNVYKILKERGYRAERLDADFVRRSMNFDLGFSKEDRDKNIRRVGSLAKLLSRNGTAVVCSFISPYQAQRDKLRNETENFVEIFCSAPLKVCEQRDEKGLYKKARKGEIKDFTGISSPYEEPTMPELELDTVINSVQENTERILSYLKEKDIL